MIAQYRRRSNKKVSTRWQAADMAALLAAAASRLAESRARGGQPVIS
jgi:hypothetical protein